MIVFAEVRSGLHECGQEDDAYAPPRILGKPRFPEVDEWCRCVEHIGRDVGEALGEGDVHVNLIRPALFVCRLDRAIPAGRNGLASSPVRKHGEDKITDANQNDR